MTIAKNDLVPSIIGIAAGLVTGLTVSTIMETLTDASTEKGEKAYDKKERRKAEAENTAMHIGSALAGGVVTYQTARLYAQMAREASKLVKDIVK